MKRYPKPPVNEVVAEFYFQDPDWDWIVPGLLYGQIQDSFPVRRMGLDNLGNQRVYMLSKDETRLVQVANGLLAVHNIKDYSHWQDFSPIIKSAFENYRKVVSTGQLARLGLQYVNKLVFDAPDGRVDLEDYLEFYPFAGKKLPRDHGLFSMNVQYLFGEQDETAVAIQLSAPQYLSPTLFQVNLDIKCLPLKDVPQEPDRIFSWFETAHTHLSEVFEGCITNKTRKLFEG